MLLVVQVLIIIVLLLTLISIYIDELRDVKRKAPHALLEEIWVGKERRRTVRLEKKLDVLYFYAGEKKTYDAKKTYTEDISTGGARLYFEEKLTKGTPVFVEVSLSDMHKPIIARAEIAWVKDTPIISSSGRRSFETGIRFTHIKSNDEKCLSSFIKKQLGANIS